MEGAYLPPMTAPEYSHLKVVHFRSPSAADRWLKSLEHLW